MSSLNVSAANLAAAKQIVLHHGMKRGIVLVHPAEKDRAPAIAHQISKLLKNKSQIIVSIDPNDEASAKAARKFGTSRQQGFVVTHSILHVAEGTGVYVCETVKQEVRREKARKKRYGWAAKEVWERADENACLKRLQKLGLANFGRKRVKFTEEQHEERAEALLVWSKTHSKPAVGHPLYAMLFQYMNPNHPLYREDFERRLRRYTRGRWKFNASTLREVA